MIVVFGTYSGLCFALSNDPWLYPVSCHDVVRLLGYTHCVFYPKLSFVWRCFVVLGHTADGAVAVFLLVEGLGGWPQSCRPLESVVGVNVGIRGV